MRFSHVIGIDPGPIPGIVHLALRAGGRNIDVDVIQCTDRTAPLMLWALLDSARFVGGTAPAIVAIEKFVVGRASMRSGRAGGVTRDLVGKLVREAEDQPSVTVLQRTASQVKPWATDTRLEAAGLLEATKGMRHARDAARHALFCAVHDAGAPDPLSRKATR